MSTIINTTGRASSRLAQRITCLSTARHARGMSTARVTVPRNSLPQVFLLVKIACGGLAFGLGLFSLKVHADAGSTRTEKKFLGEENGHGDLEVTGVALDQKEQCSRWRKQLGVHLWGSNRYKIAEPNSSEAVITSPRGLDSLRGKVFRHLALGRTHAACIDVNGDLHQWGAGYFCGAPENGDFPTSKLQAAQNEPEKSLVGANLVRVALSDDKVYALAQDGTLYIIPAARELQRSPNASPAVKPSWWTWISAFGGNPGNGIAGATLHLPPAIASKGEKIVEISSGAHHICALTNKGRVFTALADRLGNRHGQTGTGTILSPEKVDDSTTGLGAQLNIVVGLNEETVAQVACGEEHTAIRTVDGKVLTCGSNSAGQLGLGDIPERESVASPTQITRTWPNNLPAEGDHVVLIAAGGNNTYFVIGHAQDEEHYSIAKKTGDYSQVDVFAVGNGREGQLGTGRYTTYQGTPARIRALSGLTEYKEPLKGISPIGIKNVVAGASHAATVLDNSREEKVKDDVVVYGNDVFVWGSNSEGQCGPGQRQHISIPSHLPVLQHTSSEFEKANEIKDLETVETHINKSGRMQLSPSANLRVAANGRSFGAVEQVIELGYAVTAVYGKVESKEKA